MNAEPFESDEAPFFPLIGFNAGMVDGAVALRFEFAACREHYEAREGETQQFVMSPEAAIEIGSALIEQGRLAQSGGSLV
jgi:hypothetical protein